MSEFQWFALFSLHNKLFQLFAFVINYSILKFLLFIIHRMYSLVDSSRVSTFLISMLLIVYGSFRYTTSPSPDPTPHFLIFHLFVSFNRSLNMEEEAKQKEKDTGIQNSENSSVFFNIWFKRIIRVSFNSMTFHL